MAKRVKRSPEERRQRQSAYNAQYWTKNSKRIVERRRIAVERRRIAAKPRDPAEAARRLAKKLEDMDEKARGVYAESRKARNAVRRVFSSKLEHKRTKPEIKYDITRIHKLQDGKCAALHCRCDLSGGYHIDHIIPIYYSGSNESCNLQLLCAPCNFAKGKKHPSDWKDTLWWKVKKL